MTDRCMVYTGAIPQADDFNGAQQDTMIGIGFLAEAVMGSPSWAYGLAPAATAPASLTINIGRGAIGTESVVDTTNPGSSAIADTAHALMKIGINLGSTALTFVAPATAGQSQVFLIQGQMQETDTGAEVLPYYNAGNPSQPFSGPNNTGAANNTVRAQRVVLQTIAGAPAATGSQTTPSATTGWVPLYTITLANGQTTISAAQVVQHPNAPFVPFSLPKLTPGFSHLRVFTSSATFVGPAGVTLGKVRVWGGGGGGGGAAGTGSGGSGGAGGGYSEGLVAITPGGNHAVTVGAAGAAGTGVPTNGGAGGSSSFASQVTATGGGPGLGGLSGLQPAGSTGGSGAGGSLNISGTGGGTPYAISGTVSAGIGGGTSGTSNTGVQANPTSFSGSGGAFPGGGGNGGGVGGNGGAGAGGLVILEY